MAHCPSRFRSDAVLQGSRSLPQAFCPWGTEPRRATPGPVVARQVELDEELDEGPDGEPAGMARRRAPARRVEMRLRLKKRSREGRANPGLLRKAACVREMPSLNQEYYSSRKF